MYQQIVRTLLIGVIMVTSLLPVAFGMLMASILDTE